MTVVQLCHDAKVQTKASPLIPRTATTGRSMADWRNGHLSHDLGHLHAADLAGDLDARAQLRMLDSIRHRQKN